MLDEFTIDSAQDERRAHPRARVLWSGTLSANGHVADGIVLDVSVGGAKVAVNEPFTTAGDISLRIPRFGVFRGNVVWRKENVMGVRFRDDPRLVSEIMSGDLPVAN